MKTSAPSREELRELLQDMISELEFTITTEEEVSEEEAEHETASDGDDVEECAKCGSEEIEVSEEEDEDGDSFETVEYVDCGWREERDV